MIKKLTYYYKIADSPLKLIYINIGIFLIFQILNTLSYLTENSELNTIEIFGLPSQFSHFIFKPWSLFTYMFTHQDFIHIVLNLIWLHFSGKIFTQYFNSQKLIDVYILGGIIGGICYLLAYRYLPVFQNQTNFLIGASGSVLAVLFASASFAPNYKVNLAFLGPVSIKYIALSYIFIDVISIPIGNAGGHIAHLGGALSGIVFVSQWKKQIDITKYLNKYRRNLIGIFKNKNLKTLYKRPITDDEYRLNKKVNSKKVDDILEIIANSGYDSLSEDEKDFLFKQSKNL